MAIATLTGENGILSRTQNSKEETRGASVYESVELWKQELKLAKLTKNTSNIKTTEELVDELLRTKLITEEEKDIILGNESKGIEAEYKITIGSKTIDFFTSEYREGIPGLYATNTNALIKSWDELTEGTNPYITVVDNVITGCSSGLKSIKGDLVIADGTTEIGYQAFSGYKKLTKIEFPSTLKTIGNFSFQSCTGISTITIPSTIENIGGYAFYCCTGISEIRVQTSNATVGTAAFFPGGNQDFSKWPTGVDIIYEEGVTNLIPLQCPHCQSITIPSTAISIGNSAFSGYKKLTKIEFPSTLKTIGNYSFQSCTGITTITIPSTIENIGDYAFYCCTGISEIRVQTSNATVGTAAFFPGGNQDFSKWPTGVDIIYEEGVTKILKLWCPICTSATIPSTATEIIPNAFSGCAKLTSININKEKDSISGSPWGATNATIIWKNT